MYVSKYGSLHKDFPKSELEILHARQSRDPQMWIYPIRFESILTDLNLSRQIKIWAKLFNKEHYCQYLFNKISFLKLEEEDKFVHMMSQLLLNNQPKIARAIQPDNGSDVTFVVTPGQKHTSTVCHASESPITVHPRRLQQNLIL